MNQLAVVDQTIRGAITEWHPSWMEHPVYALARVAGEVAERENGMVCGHCVANHIIDVFDRYVRIHEPLHERS